MISQTKFLLTLMVMVSILYAGDVASMEHPSYSLAVISTPKSMIRCDESTMFSLGISSSGCNSFSFEIDRLHNGCVISQYHIWDPGLSLEIEEDEMESRTDYLHKVCLILLSNTSVYPFRIATGRVCRSTQKECVDRRKSGAVANRVIGICFSSAMALMVDTNRTRINNRFDLLWASRRLSKIPSNLISKCRLARKPPWNYWAEMEFEMAMGMIPYLQEGERRKHNTSNRSFFLFLRETDDLTTTSKSRQQLKVMLKAFWSLSYMLLAINIKYMKGGPIRHSLIARKGYVQQAGLTHSIIEATASHICENRLYPSSRSLLYKRICVSNLVSPNDVSLCYQ